VLAKETEGTAYASESTSAAFREHIRCRSADPKVRRICVRSPHITESDMPVRMPVPSYVHCVCVIHPSTRPHVRLAFARVKFALSRTAKPGQWTSRYFQCIRGGGGVGHITGVRPLSGHFACPFCQEYVCSYAHLCRVRRNRPQSR